MEVPVPVAPPVKSPKKSALKKSKPTTVAPAQVFSSINPENIVATPPVAAPTSPARKRRAAGDAEGGTTKRSRKGAAEKEVVAARPLVERPIIAGPRYRLKRHRSDSGL